ncbi:GNAT family N-acetyltransferase, partial [Acinetobacter baumannii]
MTNRLHFINQSPFDFMYVYEENNSVLGILGFRIRENIEEVSRFGEVSVIVVNTETRGQGIGRSLMKYAEELSKKHECLGT